MANEINIADKATLDAVNTNVNTINTNVSTTKTNVSTVNTNVGSNSDTASATGSVHAKLKDIKSSLSAGLSSIKSVQRGVLAKQGINATSVNIPISSVNISKSFVIFPVLYSGVYGEAYPRNLYAQLTSSTNLQVTNDSEYDWTERAGSIAWQVVEFY